MAGAKVSIGLRICSYNVLGIVFTFAKRLHEHCYFSLI